jgi:2-dehydro-3-deoxygalactonokinase
MDFQGKALDYRRSDQGMNCLNSTQFEPVLIELIEDWFNKEGMTQVLACGMVGSRQGWVEASYLSAPCSPYGSFTTVPVNDPRVEINILPGIKQLSPADVMRGEETQIAGLLINDKTFTGVVCLPGTHSKWANIVNGKVTQFQTFLTGELFALLSKQSVLRHCLDDSSWHEEAFQSAVKDSLQHPERVSAELFSIRAQSLVSDLPATAAYSRLSGLLIGLELANCEPYLAAQNIQDLKVIVIGESTLSKHYSSALNLMSIKTRQENSETMTLQGLTLAYKQLSAI